MRISSWRDHRWASAAIAALVAMGGYGAAVCHGQVTDSGAVQAVQIVVKSFEDPPGTGSEGTAGKETAGDQDADPGKRTLWLGIQLKRVDGDLAAYLGSDVGVFVVGVVPDSPAGRAGIQTGDVLLAADGQELSEPRDLIRVVEDAASEDEDRAIRLTVLRRNKKQTVEVTPEQAPVQDGPHRQADGIRQRLAEALRGKVRPERAEELLEQLMRVLSGDRPGDGGDEEHVEIFGLSPPVLLWRSENGTKAPYVLELDPFPKDRRVEAERRAREMAELAQRWRDKIRQSAERTRSSDAVPADVAERLEALEAAVERMEDQIAALRGEVERLRTAKQGSEEK